MIGRPLWPAVWRMRHAIGMLYFLSVSLGTGSDLLYEMCRYITYLGALQSKKLQKTL